MSEQSLLPIAVQPVISYPREAEVGKTYLMTIDLQVVEGSEWQFEEEEYPLYCIVDSEPLFSCKAVGEPAIVLHRFGGTYGTARFLLSAVQTEEAVGQIRLVLVNNWGVPIKTSVLYSTRVAEETQQTPKTTVSDLSTYSQVEKTRNGQKVPDTSTGMLSTELPSTPSLGSIQAEVIKQLTKPIIEIDWEQPHKVDRQLLQHAVEEYVRTYEKRHCTLKYDALRMDNLLALEEIYTDVQVLNTRESRRFESPEALRELFLETGRGFVFEKATRQEGIAVANLEPRLMVLGSPGIGKSTFLRKVGLEALKWQTARYRHELIPVFIELKQFGDRHRDIEELIDKEFETCGFPNAKQLTRNLLQAGKLLILLDGLDEVPMVYADRAIEQIGKLVDRYGKNRFIVSCRVAAYKGGFSSFKDVTMANFNDLQMKTFVRHWFRREPEIADQCWELLNSSEYKAVKELGQSPLFLTLICAIYDESQSLPKQRAALYGEVLEVWLKKWAAERRVHRDPIYQELNLGLEQALLSEIAYQSFAEDQLFLSKRVLAEQIRAFLVNNLNAPSYMDSEKVLYAIQVQQGILVERARDIYSFSHLSFQEYLTAQYIVDNQQVDVLVTRHLIDQRWREIFLLVSGLMRNADGLLTLMESEAQRLIRRGNLKILIQWADDITNSSTGDIKPAAKRSVALLYAQAHNLKFAPIVNLANKLKVPSTFIRDLALDLDVGFVRDLIHCKIFTSATLEALIEQLEAMKAAIPNNNEPLEVRRSFEDRIYQLWYDALHLNPDWLKLTEEETNSLNNYLYANELMICCREAALRVSPQVWNAIESRMLTVQD